MNSIKLFLIRSINSPQIQALSGLAVSLKDKAIGATAALALSVKSSVLDEPIASVFPGITAEVQTNTLASALSSVSSPESATISSTVSNHTFLAIKAPLADLVSSPTSLPPMQPIDPAFLALNQGASLAAHVSLASATVGIGLPIGMALGYGAFLTNEIRKVKQEEKLLSHTPETLHELAALHNEMLALASDDPDNHREKRQAWYASKGRRYTILLASLLTLGNGAYRLISEKKPIDEKALEKLIDFFMDPTAEKFGDGLNDFEFEVIENTEGTLATEEETGPYYKRISCRFFTRENDFVAINANFASHARNEKPRIPEQIVFYNQNPLQRDCTYAHPFKKIPNNVRKDSIELVRDRFLRNDAVQEIYPGRLHDKLFDSQ